MKIKLSSSYLAIISLLALAGCEKSIPDPKANDNAQIVILEPTNSRDDTVAEPSKRAQMATDVYWGDTHLHTRNSFDAFSVGNRLGADDALRFAKGEMVVASVSGIEAQLDRPLDFLVIADHAVGMGLAQEILEGNKALTSDPVVARWAGMMRKGGAEATLAAGQIVSGHAAGTNPKVINDKRIVGPIMKSIWAAHGNTVERHNDPGIFSAFVGYEYTPMPNGNNLHRVVIFRDGSDKTSSILPFSSSQSKNPEDLWAALERYETKTGGQVLAIPHNPNISGGKMFAFSDFEGNRIDAAYAKTRARWEPLVEATQMKGDSESHPFLSPTDEFASFGDAGWDKGNLSLDVLETDEMFAGEYVREGLKRGLNLEQQTGVNPFKFGMIGSTDSHTSLSETSEDKFLSKSSDLSPSINRAMADLTPSHKGIRFGWQTLASGYAAVWAHENTREAIFDAMLRKEVYATTGTRIKLRMFAGWGFSKEDLSRPDFVKNGYENGVPMGGDLISPLNNTKKPTLLIYALRDPEGANLDRIQIVKGWLDKDGLSQEKIYDIAWSGGREIGKDGKLPTIGHTVDLSIPSWDNSIGAAELKTVWTDPNFDLNQAAFYYARVLEIPTPTWLAYDKVRYGAKLPKDAPLISQERAYSSPIWYSPSTR